MTIFSLPMFWDRESFSGRRFYFNAGLLLLDYREVAENLLIVH